MLSNINYRTKLENRIVLNRKEENMKAVKSTRSKSFFNERFLVSTAPQVDLKSLKESENKEIGSWRSL